MNIYEYIQKREKEGASRNQAVLEWKCDYFVEVATKCFGQARADAEREAAVMVRYGILSYDPENPDWFE